MGFPVASQLSVSVPSICQPRRFSLPLPLEQLLTHIFLLNPAFRWPVSSLTRLWAPRRQGLAPLHLVSLSRPRVVL